jgi:SAM-dependent methyltransferase
MMKDEFKQPRLMTTKNVCGPNRACDLPSAGTHHASRVTYHSSLITHRSSLSDAYKERAREQWGANPCGANVARDMEFGSREYFDAIETNRYEFECPWIKRAIGFDRYEGKRLLEVGFGTGTDLLQFARGGAHVTGVDLTPRSIEIARRRFEVYGLTGEFAIGDGESLSFPDSSFDVVYSFGVLHHTPDTARAVHEIYRILKPGGKAIVMLYHRASLYYWGSLFLKHGILGGEFFKESMAQIMSRRVEYSETGGRPLVKAYTRNEGRRMFSDFRNCELQVNQLTRRELRPVGRLLPEPLFQWLARNFGWNLLITATK